MNVHNLLRRVECPKCYIVFDDNALELHLTTVCSEWTCESKLCNMLSPRDKFTFKEYREHLQIHELLPIFKRLLKHAFRTFIRTHESIESKWTKLSQILHTIQNAPDVPFTRTRDEDIQYIMAIVADDDDDE